MTNFNNSDFPPLPSKSKEHNDSSKAVKTRVPVVAGEIATMNDLPEELLLEVLRYLPGIDLEHFQLASLVSLSSTSRNFHRLVAKKLNASYNSHFCEPYLFLRTVLENADLAGLVEHADITYGTWSHRERTRYRANAQDKKAIKEGMKALGIPDWKRWATDCNTDFVELETLHTAILMHTPNICSINITHGPIGNYTGIPTPRWIDLFRRANQGTSLGHTHRFQNLRSIKVNADDLELSRLAPIFRTPSLRKVHLKSIFEYDEADERAEQDLRHAIPQGCNNLEELQLESSVVRIDVLGVLVASARSLKIFGYEMGLNNLPATQNLRNIAGVNTLTAILQCQQTSLESLTFTTDEDLEADYPAAFNLHHGLQDFHALKHLSCGLGSIVDHSMDSLATPFENLSRSLTTLRLFLEDESIGNKDVLAIMEHAAHDLAMDLPLVRELRLTVGRGLSGKCDWARLVTPFSETDINLVIEEEQDEEDGWNETWQVEGGITNPVWSEAESESSGEVSLYSTASRG